MSTFNMLSLAVGRGIDKVMRCDSFSPSETEPLREKTRTSLPGVSKIEVMHLNKFAFGDYHRSMTLLYTLEFFMNRGD